MSSENRRLGSPVRHEEEKSHKKKTPSSNLKAEIISWIQILLTAACIAFVLNTFIIANSKVPSGSMENTIMTDDRVIGSRLTYRFSDPERGDIAIFHFPDDESIYYVKRIIGLPGDTVDIINGAVYLNGSETPLEEPYLKEAMLPEEDMHFEVPEDSYFMMGDNRNFSYDARYWNNHFVKRDKIIAKVMFRYWPLTEMGTVK
ncbi:MAG: signal peptidase I [Lachnospiraceae bacterium]|nr:signal peptidase I [Lachnospiraceae bacterium]